MSLSKIQVGVIGAGGMGGRHALNLTERVVGAQVVAVMDIDKARAEAIASACGGARVYTDAPALITDTEVEAVLIASPDPTHAELAMACIKAGKPTLCEKPLATTVAEAEQILHAEIAAGQRLIQVGFMREYDPAHKNVKEIVTRGDIGQPLMFRGVHSNLSIGYDRTIADVIINSAVHDIHSARWLLGEEIAFVYAQCVAANIEQPESCRLVLIQATFTNGSLGVIEVNADSGYGYEVDVKIVGERGTVQTPPLSSPAVRKDGGRTQSIETDWLERFETAYVNEAQAWVRSLLDRKPTGPTVWDGYVSLVVADACLKSAQTSNPQAVRAVERPSFYYRHL